MWRRHRVFGLGVDATSPRPAVIRVGEIPSKRLDVATDRAGINKPLCVRHGGEPKIPHGRWIALRPKLIVTAAAEVARMTAAVNQWVALSPQQLLGLTRENHDVPDVAAFAG